MWLGEKTDNTSVDTGEKIDIDASACGEIKYEDIPDSVENLEACILNHCTSLPRKIYR